jgi:Spy/CpxP family protein refolding chaperone
MAAILATGLLMTANGQDRQGPPNQQNFQQMRQQRIDELKKLLVLTKEQNTKFDAIYKETDDKIAAARQNAGEDRSAMRTKMQELNKERDQKIEKILTPEQVKKFQDYLKKQEEMRQNRQGGPGGGGPGRGGDRS